MKILINKWDQGNEAASVKFFAESVLELTNMYSASSYRHRTLSTVAKAGELRRSIRDVQSRIVRKPYLSPIIKEYDHALETDPIVRNILDFNSIPLSALRISIEDTLEKMSAAIAIFFDLIAEKYEDSAKDIIIETCGSGRREKDFICACAGHYISHVVGKGRSREHVHIAAKRAFSSIDIVGEEMTSLKEFFSDCKNREKSYEIILNVNKSVGQYLLDNIGVTIFENRDDLPVHFRNSIFSKHGLNEVGPFAVITSMSGNDPFVAARRAKFAMELLHAFHFVFPNSANWHLPELACAYDAETGGVYLVKLSEHIHEGRRISSIKAHRDLIEKMGKFTFGRVLEKEKSGLKIINALQSASAASRIPEVNARLTSIWSAFEALLPHPAKDGESTVRINHFESYITPLIATDYINSLYRNYYNDLARNLKGSFSKFLTKNGQGESKFDRFISIFFSESEVKHEFTSLMNRSELLLHRAQQLDRLANSVQELRSKIEAHENRVSWQLHRIYRARNAIVHSGASYKYTAYLAENAFSYFRSLMSVLVLTGSKHGVSDSDALFDLCVTLCREKRNSLFKIDKAAPMQFLLAATSPIVSLK